MTERLLLLGYGNPGRRDDGLGPAVAAAIAERAFPGVTVDSDYQLQVEDAARVADHDVVVFADAAAEGEEPFSFRRVHAVRELSFTTHSVSPGAVLALSQDHFGAAPRAYVLGIRGYDFAGFGEGLSDRAETNLVAALEFLTGVIRDRSDSRCALGVMP